MIKYLLFVLLIFLSYFGNAQSKKILVDKNGSGDFTTVQDALDAIPYNNKLQVTIFIKNGIYKEKLHLDSTKRFVTIIGEDKFKTILTCDDHSGKKLSDGSTISTVTSYSFLVRADDFTARNITVQNDAGFNAGQAVALESDGDKAQFYNCRFTGFQDVLFTRNPNSRQYFKDCYIEGTTDFIFGPSAVWFEHCHIHGKKDSYITAASTPEEHGFGYVFNDCMITADTSVHRLSLGRPWRPFASVTYIHCYLSHQIIPEGWSNWNKTENYKTTRYAEYENYGPGSDQSKRVAWAKQLNDDEAKKITVVNVLNGWMPKDCDDSFSYKKENFKEK